MLPSAPTARRLVVATTVARRRARDPSASFPNEGAGAGVVCLQLIGGAELGTIRIYGERVLPALRG